MTLEEYIKEKTHTDKPNHYKVTGCVGVRDFHKMIRKHKWFNIGRPVSEHEFYVIIRSINKLLADNLVKEGSMVIPATMGKLEIAKKNTEPKVHKGKLCIKYPIDWQSTLKLWYEDKEAEKNKIVVRFENEYTYHIKFDKYKSTCGNKCFYEFTPHRRVKRALRDSINEGIIDALW